ncbi:MAG: hypothetical protein AB8B74_04850 [Crocinitomicaceae bacterium]
MLKGFVTGIFLLCFGLINAQISTYIGVKPNALGNAAVNLNGVWSLKNNPGVFGFMEKSQVSVVYQNRFILSELSTQSLAFGYHTNLGNLGLFFHQSGFELYRAVQIGGAYGLKLSPKLGMGVNFSYQQTRFGDIYGGKHHFIAGLGVQYKLSQSLFIGAGLQNINRSKLSDFQNERLPTIFSMGVLYKISPKVVWVLDLEKEITEKLNVKSGLAIKSHHNFEVRLGVNSYPFQSSFGFGVYIKELVIDFAAIWHASIGLTPSLGILYKF